MTIRKPETGKSGAAPARRHTRASGEFERLRDGKRLTLTGRTDETLLALVEVGPRGVTAAELSSWALRLAAYVADLREAGFDIETRREPHAGGAHGRYVLRDGVRVLAYTPASRG